MPPEPLGDRGEFALLARLRARLGSQYLGDDAAILSITPGMRVLATVDAQVDGVHFLRQWMSPRQIGRRAIAVNVSDIAAMGGRPRFALISLLLPNDRDIVWMDGLYEGIREEAARWGMEVVGGNISSTTGPLIVDVIVLGEVDEGLVLRRRGARPEDVLLVTGDLGRSAAGLRLLQQGGRGPLVEAYCTPSPRIREGEALARSGRVHAAMDLSDGLASDLHRLGEESGVGAVIDAALLPISDDVYAAAASLELDPVGLAVSGGEDFELLIAAARDDVDGLVRLLGEIGTPLTVIGEVRPAGEGIRVRSADGSLRSLAGGWDHFAPRDRA